MTAKFTVSGAKTKVVFTWEAPTTKTQNTIDAFAHSLWDRGLGDHGIPEFDWQENTRTWDDVTNQEKLNIVHDYLLLTIINSAKAYGQSSAKGAAGTQEEIDAETKYGLE